MLQNLPGARHLQFGFGLKFVRHRPINILKDGADTAEKENLSQLAARQQKFINNLENALIRIKNGTYGICVDTGKLIPKERLRAVPHTMHCIEAKLNRS